MSVHFLEISFKRQLVCKFDITKKTHHFIGFKSIYLNAFAYILRFLLQSKPILYLIPFISKYPHDACDNILPPHIYWQIKKLYYHGKWIHIAKRSSSSWPFTNSSSSHRSSSYKCLPEMADAKHKKRDILKVWLICLLITVNAEGK